MFHLFNTTTQKRHSHTHTGQKRHFISLNKFRDFLLKFSFNFHLSLSFLICLNHEIHKEEVVVEETLENFLTDHLKSKSKNEIYEKVYIHKKNILN